MKNLFLFLVVSLAFNFSFASGSQCPPTKLSKALAKFDFSGKLLIKGFEAPDRIWEMTAYGPGTEEYQQMVEEAAEEGLQILGSSVYNSSDDDLMLASFVSLSDCKVMVYVGGDGEVAPLEVKKVTKKKVVTYFDDQEAVVTLEKK
jgi:hypothetical protein